MFKKYFQHITSKNAPKWLVLAIDIYIVTNTFIFAYLIRFNFQLNFDLAKFSMQLPLIASVALLSFLIVGSYKGIVRHTGVRDAINIFVANSIMLLFLGGMVLVNRSFNIVSNFTIPLSILVIHYLLNMLLLIASRFIFKEIYCFLISDYRTAKRVLIYGTDEAGILTYSVLKDDKENSVQIIGFIDDEKSKKGKTINRLNVYDSAAIDKEFISSKKVDEIILATQKIQPSQLIELTTNFAQLSVKVKIAPPIKTWIESELKSHQIKDVNVVDLLGRAPIELNNPILAQEFSEKIVLITGAAGSIGSEIAKQAANFNYKHIILIDQAESELYNLQQYFSAKNLHNITSIVADVRNEKRIDSIFKQYQPAIVYHAAAYKHVPFMEENPYESVCVNVLGTKIVAELSLKYTVEKFVMISTDKAVNPTNVMGATKRIAEMYMSCLNKKGSTKFITTRFGNVLGSNGSVIPLFQSQIKNGGPLTVTHKEITRYFMTIPEACQLVLEAGAMGKGGEIFVFDMGESIKIYDLALNMIHLSGKKYPDDIAIDIIGLRPGEKIHEELLGTSENTTATYHHKIMIAKIKETDDEENVCDKIITLCDLNKEMNIKSTVLKIKEIVPEFISNNSKYEALDVKPKV